MGPAPIDLPDEPDARVPEFRSRRKAEALPPLKPAAQSNGLEPKARGVRVIVLDGWQSGFRWGVAATVGGLALFFIVAAEVLK